MTNTPICEGMDEAAKEELRNRLITKLSVLPKDILIKLDAFADLIESRRQNESRMEL